MRFIGESCDMPERVRWYHWLAAAAVCGAIWWLALVYFQYETLVVTAVSAALTAIALTAGRSWLPSLWFRFLMAAPFAICLGACTVGVAWGLALIL